MLENIYNQKITILNKLKRQDSTNKVSDEWFKYVINNAVWYTDSTRTATASSVFIGTYITVLIPFSDKYIPYIEWKQSDKRNDHYTISIGDYIVLGEVEDDINANNIVKITEKFGENVCLVKHHKTMYNRFGATVQLRIEGI